MPRRIVVQVLGEYMIFGHGNCSTSLGEYLIIGYLDPQGS